MRTMRRASSATETQLAGLPMLKMRRVAAPFGFSMMRRMQSIAAAI
jgi:hypothetical protein